MVVALRSLARRPSALASTRPCRQGLDRSRQAARPISTPAKSQPWRSLPAIFARGGTSNGLVILRPHLPPPDVWPQVLPSVMGSPDPHGRQLDGMGSGVSSTSKICILAPSPHPDADVEFTFVQLGVRDGKLDMAGNCGNMSSIIGPVSLDEGLLGRRPVIKRDSATGFQTTVARILNTNTGKIIHSRFRVAGDPPRYCPEGDYEMDGVPGRQSKIVLSFLDPAGAKTGRARPTGNAIDRLILPDGDSIEASLIDVSNPGVFVRVSDLGIEDPESLDPSRIERDQTLTSRLNQIRSAGAAAMGLDPDIQSVPKIVLVFPRPPPDSAVHVKCLALSMGQAHKAVPLTLALCLGTAVHMPGTIPRELSCPVWGGESIRIGHPSGSLEVGTTVKDGKILSAELYRTARVLMKGEVFYRINGDQRLEG